MLKKIYENYKNFEALTLKILKSGLTFCFIISLIALAFCIIYDLGNQIPEIYYIGLALLKLSFFFAVDFIICAFVTDGIKKQII
jgi:Na+/H+ antiporter NhaC